MAITLIAGRDYELGQHSRRVAQYAVRLAHEIPGILEASEVYTGALLHDVGKIAVDDAILRSRGALNEREREAMQLHPLAGYGFIHSFPELSAAIPAVRWHHERIDGNGYPDGLKGEAIPLFARIVSVADAFDAMTSDRPYQKAKTFLNAQREIEAGAGSQFCPRVVEAFSRIPITEWKRIREFRGAGPVPDHPAGVAPNDSGHLIPRD